VTVYALILLVSGVFYWLVWNDMRRPLTTGADGLIGRIGVVTPNGVAAVKVFININEGLRPIPSILRSTAKEKSGTRCAARMCPQASRWK